MKSPWMSRVVHEAILAGLEARLGVVETDRDYWRSRCERLTDAALLRRGEVAGPVFADPRPSADPVRNVFAAASHIASHLGAPIGVRVHHDAD